MKRKPTGKAANPMRARDEKLLQKLAVYLNFHADAVTEADVRALADEFSLTNAQAFALLLAGALGLDAAENEEDARTVREDFPRMLHPLDAAAYANDPYARALRAAASREQSLPDKPTDPAAHFHASRAALSREDISHTLHPRCAAADAGAPRESNAGGRRSASCTLLPQNAAAGTDAPRESNADERRSASCTLLPQNAAAGADAPRESNAGGHEDALRTRRSRNTLGRENASQAGAFELGYASYRPYELFVADDLRAYPDGAVLPVLGYFTRPFAYPVLTENGREWMTATPNEINTIRPMAEAAHGHVLTLGLGLGYFAFHALLNPRVERVTAVERSADAIRLFRERILPAFPRPECLTILQADAFAAAPALYQSGQYDFVFADLWHDAADGLPMYELLKQMEVPGPEYRYWIEKTLEFYR
ncbi:MAG: hypothetical protein MR914_07320 [Clostridiales bacterium]|nr:hypothetical protein [Clostridiales bacterium]